MTKMRELASEGLCYRHEKIWVLDQRLLPHQEEWIVCENPSHMALLITRLSVRGAPLIGVAAALALADFALKGASALAIQEAAALLRASRPTAVNLMWALDSMLSVELSPKALAQRAEKIFLDDVFMCEALGNHGAALVQAGESVMTYCNAGALATAGIGTAVGVIRRAFDEGKIKHVYVNETRPLLQGGRLTAWELSKHHIPHTLICDNMAATVLREKKVQRIFVGADRIARNGDFANKVGTYSLAIVARHHGVPLYCVAPSSTLDLHCADGSRIPIEERAASEVRGVTGSFGSVSWAPETSGVFNPAFDVTPIELAEGIVLEQGYFSTKSIVDQWGLEFLNKSCAR